MKKKYDILIVDDEQVVIDSVLKLCSAEEWSVDAALDAETALMKLEKNEYRLIISDIMMPNMNGFDFLDNVKGLQLSCPVIMTTGFSTVENAVKSLYLGAIDFLPKPFTVDELLSVVSRGLQYPVLAGKTGGEIRALPDNCRKLGYASWGRQEANGTIVVGVTDLFMHTIAPVENIELFSLDAEIVQGNPCAYFNTVDDLVHQILSPFTGRIIDVNAVLEENCSLLKEDPYGKGWIYAIIPSDPDFEIKYLVSDTP